MTVVAVNGVELHVQRLVAEHETPADAPTVVCLHGMADDNLASFYVKLAPRLAEAGMNVITYDHRGHGRSSRPASGYRLSDFVADLEGLLDRLAPPRPVHLIGNSFGGTVAFSFTVANPADVASFVAIDSMPATGSWSPLIGGLLADAAKKLTDPATLGAIRRFEGPRAEEKARKVGESFRTTTMVEEVPTGPLLGDAEIASIGCPVLGVFGGESVLVGQARVLPAVLPDCTTEIVPGHSHYVLAEAGDEVSATIIRWYQRRSIILGNKASPTVV